jgi:EmrB/QacA subfamily drug resistance transporter
MSRRAIVTAGVMLGIFLSAIEATVVGTALPSIIASLEGIELYGWVVTAYLVTSTVSVPVWGRLSDLHGRRPPFLVGIAIFLAGSALAGAAHTMPHLILCRALQGLGAGAIMPIGFTMVGDIYDLSERARIQGWLSSVWGLSSVAGPLVGGYITEKLSWRWVFYLNVPPGLLAALLIGLAWREPREPSHGRLRVAPVLLLTSSLALVLVAVGMKETLDPWLLAAAAATGAGLMALFVTLERRSDVPLLDLALFRYPMFRAVALGGPFSGIAMFAAITFAPLYIQGVLGETPTEAGKILAYLFVLWMTGSIVSPRLAVKVGFRPVAIAGGICVVVGYALLARVGLDTPYRQIALSMVVVGIGMGLTAAPLLIGVQSSVEHGERGSATALTQFSRSLGGVLGVAVIQSVLAGGIAKTIESSAARDHLSEARVAELHREVNVIVREPEKVPEADRALLRGGLAEALASAFTIALVSGVAFLVSTFLVPREIKVVKIGEFTHEAA